MVAPSPLSRASEVVAGGSWQQALRLRRGLSQMKKLDQLIDIARAEGQALARTDLDAIQVFIGAYIAQTVAVERAQAHVDFLALVFDDAADAADQMILPDGVSCCILL